MYIQIINNVKRFIELDDEELNFVTSPFKYKKTQKTGNAFKKWRGFNI